MRPHKEAEGEWFGCIWKVSVDFTFLVCFSLFRKSRDYLHGLPFEFTGIHTNHVSLIFGNRVELICEPLSLAKQATPRSMGVGSG